MSEEAIGERLLSLEELAKFVDRHPQLLRRYFKEGLLPDPAHTVRHSRKVTRKFTLPEAERIKHEFDGVKWGSMQRKRRSLGIARKK